MLLLASQMAFALMEIPPLTQRVTDLTQTLSVHEKAAFEAKLESYQQTKGNRVVVLIVPSTKPEAIEQYSIRVTETWELSRDGVDDGVLLLIAKEDRKVRIEVGYGLEGAITDLYSKRIITELIRPHFRAGDYAGGIDKALNALMGLIDGEALPAPNKRKTDIGKLGNLLPLLLFGGMVSGMMLRGIFGNFFGSAANGGLIGAVLIFIGLSLLSAGIISAIVFIFTMRMGSRGVNGYGGYPTRGGGGGFGGGGFGGGGLGGGFSTGGFGGGGASGSW